MIEPVALDSGSALRSQSAGAWLTVAVGAFWLGLVWLWDAGYLALIYDDAYYYLKTAANLARGYGPTFDQVNTTNGFHPLWLLIVTGLSLLVGEDPAHLMRWVLTLQALTVTAGLVLLGSAFPRARAWIVLVGALMASCWSRCR